MEKKLTVQEAFKFQDLTEEEKQKRGILGRLAGPCASISIPTRNGRLYCEDLWNYQFEHNEILRELIENGGVPMELDHPADRDETCSDRIAAMLPELPKKDDDGHLICYVDIIDTPLGRIAYQLAKYGFNLGISSRGNGDVYTDEDGNEAVDPETYDLQTFDLVLVPAVKDARLNLIEGLSQDNQKLLRKALRESLSHESDDNKKIMKETLKNLGIKLTEPKKKIINEDVNIQKNDDIDSSKKEEVKDNVLEVKDNESNELLKQLQEALKSKVDTDKQLQSLQEQLAVSDTKVKKLEEELGRYKQSTINLSNQVRESKNLNKDIESLKEQVETKDKMIKVLSEKVSNLNESVKKANEGRQFLIEKINNDKSNATKLKETLESNHNKEVSSLNEKLNKVTKDYEVKLQESNSKLTKATKLVERYKNFVEATVNKYIESKAIMLGITPNEIKNRLNESYTLDDVDRICDDLQDYNLRISKLPFSVSKGTRISISESKKPTPKPIDDENDLSGLNEIMNRLEK